MSTRPNSKRQLLLQALAAAGHKGLLTSEGAAASGMAPHNTSSLLGDFAANGLAGSWPDPVGCLINRRRWWAAEFYPARDPGPTGQPMTVYKPRKPRASKSGQKAPLPHAGLQPIEVQHKGRAWRTIGPAARKGADVRRQPAEPAQPVPMGGVRVQRCPGWTHDPRYQVGPGEVPAGAGFAAAGVGRDVMTGQPWGRR